MNGDDNLYEIALGHYRDGRIEVAEPIYRAVLEVDPDHFSALFDLASIAKLKGNLDASAELIRKALRLKPLDLNALALLIDVLLAKGHHKDAGLVLSEVRAMEDGAGVFAQLCKRLGIDQESFSDVNRGVEVKEALATTETPRISTADASEIKGLIEVKRFDEALAKARDLCDRFPRDPFLWKAMGTALFHSGKYQAALTVMQQALAIDSVDSELLNTLGNILVELGRYSQAERCFRRAIEISPYYAEAYNSLGVVLKSLGKLDESIVCCKQALSLKPGLSEAYSNIGVVCKERGHLHQALAYYQNALAKDPGNCNAKNNIAGIFQDLGRHDESLRYYSLALKDKPQFAVAESNQLFTINYHPDWSGQDIFAAYRDYDIRYWQSLRVNWRSHSNGREPERRLRLGYVSPDFFSHAIRYMLEPLLECHDHERFEVFAYAQLVREDAQTARYRSLVDHWVPTRGLSDVQLAERIRADGIDILVDLAGHTANNRLGAFARKPAPVSVSLWVGYGYTSGLSAIDYFLCDEVLVPEGAEELFSERPWRIAAPAGMYRPSEGMGAVNVLPALERGYITFGTLTRGVRVNHRTIRVWSEILERVPGARLVVNSRDFSTEAEQEALAERFAAHGIGGERLEIGYHSPPWDVLRGMDIGLDCFPHNSGTTLLESLYMGVPFVTLADRPSVGRIGAMILSGLGREEWIATDEADYVERVVALAADPEALATTRAGLRAQMEASPWRDEQGQVARIEAAYRAMWRRWCDSTSAPA